MHLNDIVLAMFLAEDGADGVSVQVFGNENIAFAHVFDIVDTLILWGIQQFDGGDFPVRSEI